MHECLARIADTLKAQLNEIPSPGLFTGKMGACIFFYHMSRATSNPEYEQMADNLIDEIYSSIAKDVQPLDFENGLAGIAWGFHYLKEQGFMDGDTDEALGIVDDKIFQFITFSDALNQKPLETLLGFGFYLIKRLEGREVNAVDEKVLLLQKLLINIINKVYAFLEKIMAAMPDPPFFTLNYHLPLCLIFISQVYRLGLYNNKLDKLLELLSPAVLSTLPRQTGNRLYLLLSIAMVRQQFEMEGWKKHAQLLKNSIDLDHLLYHEMGDKNISLFCGKAGILLLLELLNNHFPMLRLPYNKEQLLERIATSGYWELPQREINIEYLGYVGGIAGIGFALVRQLSRYQDIAAHTVT